MRLQPPPSGEGQIAVNKKKRRIELHTVVVVSLNILMERAQLEMESQRFQSGPTQEKILISFEKWPSINIRLRPIFFLAKKNHIGLRVK